MNITHIQIVSIPVRDQAVAKAFYANVLGFEVRRDDPMGPDQRWIELVPPGAQTSITLVTWFDNMPPGSVQGLVLNTTNVEEDLAALQKQGVNCTPLDSAPWGKFSTFRDPDGNGWVLQEAVTGA